MRARVPRLDLRGVVATGGVVGIIVTATDDSLSAWRSIDGGQHWDEVATRAGGAALFDTFLDLRESACLWVAELRRTGRL